MHTVAGFFALGVLINLGPRIGRFNADGSANPILGHSVPITVIGLMLIIVGFFGFLGGCAIYMGSEQWVNIFGRPMTLSSIGFNTLMGFGGKAEIMGLDAAELPIRPYPEAGTPAATYRAPAE